MPRTKTMTKTKAQDTDTLRTILEEIRLLRGQVTLLLPQDDLATYTHPDRIKRSYQKAIKQYPPRRAFYTTCAFDGA